MTKEVSYKELLPNLKDLTLRNVVQTDAGWWRRRARALWRRVLCAEWTRIPVIATTGVSSEICHCKGTSVTVRLGLGRCSCRNPKCVRRIFTQRVAGVLVPHAQQTKRQM